MRTIYPEGYVQKVCNICGHKSTPVKIPEAIKNDFECKCINCRNNAPWFYGCV